MADKIKPTTTITNLLSDQLGSTSLATDSTGVQTAELRYTPWGELRSSSGSMPTDYKFTGQREQAELGLYFYGARWYDGSLGRFTSADTMIPSAQGVQAWDRYAYVNNNPVRYNDPTGHMMDEGDGGNYTWRDQLHDATLVKRNDDDLCKRGHDQHCSGLELYMKHHPKPVNGIFWQYSGQAGLALEGGVSYQISYVIDWKTGTVYKVRTIGGFVYGGSPTGIEGNGTIGTQSVYGIPNDVEDITDYLEGAEYNVSGSVDLDAGLLAGAEGGVSFDLNKSGNWKYTPGAGYNYTIERGIEFGGNFAPNLVDFSVQGGRSESFVVDVWHLW